MSAPDLKSVTIHEFALHVISQYKWWCMYTLIPESDSVLAAGSKIQQSPGKLTTALSAARRREGSLATEQRLVATML